MDVLTVIIVIVLLIIFTSDDKEIEFSDDNYVHKEQKKEEIFWHPVTGYKGTRSQMDTYIINRERKLKKGSPL